MSDQRFQAQLAEFQTVRDELIGSLSNQHLVLSFGSAAIGGLFAAGILAWSRGVAPAIFLAIALTADWMALMWLGEVIRMLRAAVFLKEQEEIINATVTATDGVKAPSVRWEVWRGDGPKRRLRWMYPAVWAIVALVDSGALASAYERAMRLHDSRHHLVWSPSLTLVLVAGLGVFSVCVLGFAAQSIYSWQTDALASRSQNDNTPTIEVKA